MTQKKMRVDPTKYGPPVFRKHRANARNTPEDDEI
jgi:hypothetical protein